MVLEKLREAALQGQPKPVVKPFQPCSDFDFLKIQA
jgi:hypothetical protein